MVETPSPEGPAVQAATVAMADEGEGDANISIVPSFLERRPCTLDQFQQRETSPQFQAALQYTRELMSDGKTDSERVIPIKLFSSSLAERGMEAVFFDSNNPDTVGLKDEMKNFHSLLRAANENGAGIELWLESLEILSIEVSVDLVNTGWDAYPGMTEVRKKLARAHDIKSWKRVRVTEVNGNLCSFVYTFENLSMEEIERLRADLCFGKALENLKKEFPMYKGGRIHPCFYRPCHDINNFDVRGNADFSEHASSFHIGPLDDLKEKYEQPMGWARYGFKVFGKYDDDTWLHPFDESKMWWKAYHVAWRRWRHGAPTAETALNVARGCQGFAASKRSKKVTCSPSLHHASANFAGQQTIEWNGRKKTFEFVLMCAVRPSKEGVVKNGDIWYVKDGNDIRAYGLLVREM